MLEEILDIRRRVQGQEHPETLSSMHNLGETLLKLGDLAGARKLHEETIAVALQLLGPEHRDRDKVAAMRVPPCCHTKSSACVACVRLRTANATPT